MIYKQLEVCLPEYLENLINLINKNKLENNFIFIGSFAFYFYTKLFNIDYNLRTRDIDLAVNNNPEKNINFSKILENNKWKINYDPVNNFSKFELDGVELEFLNIKFDSRVKYKSIKNLGIDTIVLPYINILSENLCNICLNNKYNILIPSPEAFLIHKLIISQRSDRNKEKKLKDIEQVKYLMKYVDPIELINIMNNYIKNTNLKNYINSAISGITNKKQMNTNFNLR